MHWPATHPPLYAEMKMGGLGSQDEMAILRVYPSSPGLPGPKDGCRAPGWRYFSWASLPCPRPGDGVQFGPCICRRAGPPGSPGKTGLARSR